MFTYLVILRDNKTLKSKMKKKINQFYFCFIYKKKIDYSTQNTCSLYGSWWKKKKEKEKEG